MTSILLGFIMDGRAGGVDKYIMNFIDAVKGEDVELDLLTNKIDSSLKKYLSDLGYGIYEIPNLRHPLAQYRAAKKIIIHGGYNMVYLNISTAIDFIVAKAAADLKVPKIYVHSHSGGNACASKKQRLVYDLAHGICKQFLYRYSTKFLACSESAGRWMFPEKIVKSKEFSVIYNAVDMDKLCFDCEVRGQVRAELGVDNFLTLIHVGYFAYPKNQSFLLEVLEETVKREKNVKLIFAGDGQAVDEIKRIAEEKGLGNYVIFLGWRGDVPRLLQGADMLLLPSFFEGLPIVGVEAQGAGLFTIMSDTISREAKISDKCQFLPIDSGPIPWADCILENKNYKRDGTEFLEIAKEYDLKNQRSQLLNLIK